MSDFADFFDYILSRRCFHDFGFIRRSSYIHSNGFIKIVFPPDADEVEEYRFHIWPKGGALSDIHNHTSDFESLILKGMIQEELFEKIEGNTYILYRCTERELTGEASLIPIETCNVRSVGKRLLGKHEAYRIAINGYHRVATSPRFEVTTLVRQLAKQRNYSFVVKLPGPGDDSISLRNPPLSEEQVTGLLNSCRETIKAYINESERHDSEKGKGA